MRALSRYAPAGRLATCTTSVDAFWAENVGPRSRKTSVALENPVGPAAPAAPASPGGPGGPCGPGTLKDTARSVGLHLTAIRNTPVRLLAHR